MVLSLHLYQFNIQSTILNLIRFDAIWSPGILVMQDTEHFHELPSMEQGSQTQLNSASQAHVFLSSHLSSFPGLQDIGFPFVVA